MRELVMKIIILKPHCTTLISNCLTPQHENKVVHKYGKSFNLRS